MKSKEFLEAIRNINGSRIPLELHSFIRCDIQNGMDVNNKFRTKVVRKFSKKFKPQYHLLIKVLIQEELKCIGVHPTSNNLPLLAYTLYYHGSQKDVFLMYDIISASKDKKCHYYLDRQLLLMYSSPYNMTEFINHTFQKKTDLEKKYPKLRYTINHIKRGLEYNMMLRLDKSLKKQFFESHEEIIAKIAQQEEQEIKRKERIQELQETGKRLFVSRNWRLL